MPPDAAITCVPAPGHEHDVTVGLPGLAADPSVLATIVLSTYTPEPAAVQPVNHFLNCGRDRK